MGPSAHLCGGVRYTGTYVPYLPVPYGTVQVPLRTYVQSRTGTRTKHSGSERPVYSLRGFHTFFVTDEAATRRNATFSIGTKGPNITICCAQV